MTSKNTSRKLFHSILFLFRAQKDAHFIERIQRNTATYVNIFSEVIDNNMPQPTVNFKDEDLSTFDVLME
jgi:hypothetical protein